MNPSRRDILKMGCASVGALMGFGLFGCSPQSDTSTSNEPVENEGANEEMSIENTTPSTAENTIPSAGNAAVVYFSCTGNTESIAQKIAEATGGALMHIEPAEPYSPADLDYNSDCRANAEQNSDTVRPALAAPAPDVANCDTVYLGYPIWWGKAPRIIMTYLKGTDLAGKTVVPFCTSGSSPISGSIAEIRKAASGANVLEGRRFPSNASQQDAYAWISSL